ncbi:MAG: hypothetical protein VB015_01165 [Erysipelotrichaceae bacterium]|nr:hypothetical protein [Erysipelotrichaceae bacterium]
MNILDNTNLNPCTYLVLRNNFKISDEPQIIFAPNGTGKTTLFNIIIRQNADDCEVYSYDESCEPTYKIVDGKKKKLVINPLPENYSKELENKSKLEKTLDSTTAISIIYPTQTIAKLKKEVKDPEILKVINENVCTLYAPLDEADRINLIFILPYFEDLKKVISDREKLFSLSEDQKESDIEALEVVDKKIIYDYYNIEEHKEEIKKSGCPLCGNKNENVYNDILKKRSEVLSKVFTFFDGFDFLRHLPNGTTPLEAINKTISGIKGLSLSKMLFLLMTKGDIKTELALKDTIDNYNEAVKNTNKYIAERDAAYEKMSSSKSTIENYFPKIYHNTSVKFDDVNKLIEINTPRNLTTYSEGEKHELYSTIRELAIVGSSKNLVIADEPLTELDVANEYKNVFRFVRLASENNKKVIIFTCNPSFINIANEYHPSLFKRYYLISHTDSNNDTLELKLLEMDFPNNAGRGAYISLSQVLVNDFTKVNNQVFDLIRERANLCISGNNANRSKEISKILHYDCSSKVLIGNTHISFCNDQFVNMIDSFTSLPSYSSFSDLVRDRVFYLTALRVYLEKKLYDYQQERIHKGLGDCFPNGAYLTKEKIKIVDGINDSYKINDKYKKWNKSTLMCLKTMLNDNDHPYSQVLPISYAISLGNDALENEILSLKDMFS